MKKLLSFVFLSFFAFGQSNAEQFSVGISGNAGLLDADGKETFNSGTTTTSEEMYIGYASIFGEWHAISVEEIGISVGANFVPYALESETTDSVRVPYETEDGSLSSGTQTVQVDIENLGELYVALRKEIPVGTFFVKAGIVEADLITNELLATGSKYGNTNLTGTFYGAGIERDIPNDLFIRAEVKMSEFDDVNLTSTGSDNTNKIDISNMSGLSGVISVGKTF
jgi:hypothetical protein